jgi:hypothetical protein
MKYEIVKGVPTAEELLAIQAVMSQHKREELAPVIRRSVYGSPQLRQPLPQQITFGARRFE